MGRREQAPMILARMKPTGLPPIQGGKSSQDLRLLGVNPSCLLRHRRIYRWNKSYNPNSPNRDLYHVEENPIKFPITFGIQSHCVRVVLLPTLACAQSIPSASGWYQIPNSTLRNVCPPNSFGGSSYQFADNCGGVVEAW